VNWELSFCFHLHDFRKKNIGREVHYEVEHSVRMLAMNFHQKMYFNMENLYPEYTASIFASSQCQCTYRTKQPLLPLLQYKSEF